MLRLVGILGVFVLVGVTALLALSIVVINVASGPEPTKNEPGAYTKAFVQDAIRHYEEDGREAIIDYYNSQESVDGEWYVVVIDEDGRMISHPTIPENVGQDLNGPAGTDVAGNFFGPDLLNATEAGKWASYVFLNPATGEQGEKHSWAVKHDGLVFVSGWYEG